MSTNVALQKAEDDALAEILSWVQEVVEGRGDSAAQMIVTVVLGCIPYVGQAVDVKGLKVLAATLQGADAKTLRETMDKLKDKLKTAAIVLAAVDGDKVQIAAGVTADSVGKVKAGELVNFVAQQVGGKGGGKPDMAMAGGTDASKLPAALASVTGWVTQQLG